MNLLGQYYILLKRHLYPYIPGIMDTIELSAITIVQGTKLTFNENVLIRAGSLAYTSLISIIPALIVMLYVLNLCFSQSEQLTIHLENILAVYLLPSTSREAVSIVFDIASKVSTNISLLGLSALLFTLLLMARELETHIQALCKTSSNFMLSVAHYVGSILVSGLVIGVMYVLMSFLQSIEILKPYLLKIDVPFIMLIGFYAVVLRIFSGYHLSWKASAVGSITAGIGLILSWKICNYYFIKSVAYSAYGALIYIPTILLWIYIVWCCVLFGASIAAALQQINNNIKT